MARKTNLFDLSALSRREIITVLAACALFLLFQITVVGILPSHFLMVALFLLFYFAHPLSRKLAFALLPFIIFEMCYDWMRLYPNYKVNSVDTKDIYEAELSLFGITSEGTTNRSTHVVADPRTGALRLLAPVEAERLQGFDDNWTQEMPERMRYFCMGNALVVPMVTRMAKTLATILAKEP